MFRYEISLTDEDGVDVVYITRSAHSNDDINTRKELLEYFGYKNVTYKKVDYKFEILEDFKKLRCGNMTKEEFLKIHPENGFDTRKHDEYFR